MKKYYFLILLTIFFFGAFLRLYPNNWDIGQHLHPDERFLTMVANDIKSPKSINEYLDPTRSTFNPSHMKYDFFVYGIFPVIITKVTAGVLHLDNYQNLNLVGRFISGFFDILSLFIVYLIARFFQKKYYLPLLTSYLTSFFYGFSVLMIQLSHFFTTDTFLQFFVICSFYLTLLFSKKQSIIYIVLSGLMFGAGIASKISAVYILPLIVILILFYIMLPDVEKRIYKISPHSIFTHYRRESIRNFFLFLTIIFIFLLSTYLSVRFFDPYLFESANILDVKISSDFLSDLQTLKSFENPDALFPPAVQWLNKTPVLYSLINLAIFGFGIFPFLFLLIGMYRAITHYKRIDLMIILFWMCAFFLYQSVQFSKTLRYFIFLFPFFSFYAAIGFLYVTKKLPKIGVFILLILCIIWPFAFFSIYLNSITRISASHFIYNTIPQEKILLIEHWDDPLPLPVENPMRKAYTIHQLPVFDVDSDEKFRTIDILLEKGDYLILSSNRGFASIPTVPKRYPRMKKYYEDLLSGKLHGFKKIKEFTSYPSLKYLGIPITFNDDFADESFTVYDHPKVIIFKKE